MVRVHGAGCEACAWSLSESWMTRNFMYATPYTHTHTHNAAPPSTPANVTATRAVPQDQASAPAIVARWVDSGETNRPS